MAENEWQPVRLKDEISGECPVPGLIDERADSLHRLAGKIIRVRSRPPVSECGLQEGRSFEIHPEDIFDSADCICIHQILAD